MFVRYNEFIVHFQSHYRAQIIGPVNSISVTPNYSQLFQDDARV